MPTSNTMLNIYGAPTPVSLTPPYTNTAITTVGAGTLTAAALVGGMISRSGPTAAFTDTTDTAVNLYAALAPNNNAGQAFELTYLNNSAFPATIAGGTGVTVSGVTLVAAGQTVTYLFTMTSATAATMVGVSMGQVNSLPDAQLVTNAGSGATTNAAGDLTGAKNCYLIITSVGATTLTTRTGAQMKADLPGIYIGQSWNLAIKNTNAGTTTLTAAASGVTLTGTMTIAQNTTRWFIVQYTADSTFVITSMGVTATV